MNKGGEAERNVAHVEIYGRDGSLTTVATDPSNLIHRYAFVINFNLR